MYDITENLIYNRIRNKSAFAICDNGPLDIPQGPNTPAHNYISLLNMSNNVDPEYIIITNNYDIYGNLIEDDEHTGVLMTDVFQELADWKTQTGIPAKVVTIDDISTNYYGDDTQEKIHNFLADVYYNYGSLYVLFGGDTNIVPEKMVYCNTGDYDLLPTDLYYVAVNSSWNNNKNAIYGEPEDIDLQYETPQFYYGRASVENISEAITFVEKSYKYENMTNITPDNMNYVNNIVVMSRLIYYEREIEKGLGRTLDKYDNSLNFIGQSNYGITQNNIEKWRLYIEDFDFVFDTIMMPNLCIGNSWEWINHNSIFSRDPAIACFSSRIPMSSIDNPKYGHFIFHLDHSSYISMGISSEIMHQTINRTDVDGFSNAPFYQIIYAGGCYPGEYHKDCITEHFINNPNGGAVAMFASSSTSSNENRGFVHMLKDLYYFVDNNVNTSPHLYTLGTLHDNSLSEGNGTISFKKRKHHLFGDPTIGIWTREPLHLTVTTTPAIISNQQNHLTVSVSGMDYSEYATNDVVVCVMKDNEIYLREKYKGTAHNHDFVFIVNPETEGELKVTVTGHNYIPYETTVPVTVTGKHIYMSGMTINDVTGNNDNNLDVGETVNFGISLKNNGTINLTNVCATICCEFINDTLNQNIGNYLTLSVPSASFGTINKNEMVTCNSYQLTLSNLIPDRTSLRLTLTISDGSGVIGTKTFVLPITAPNIEYVSLRPEVKPNGKIGLNIDLTNLGFGIAKGVSATLTSNDVQIIQGSFSYSNIAHNEIITPSFEFITNGDIHGKEFTLLVSDTYNNYWSYDFNINLISNTIENLSCENTENSIKLIWNPINNVKGYYIYKSIDENGTFIRQNDYPIISSVYNDLGLEAMQTYYYEVSYIDAMGNESQRKRIKAWTSLPVASGWPVYIPDNLGRAWYTAPNVADLTHDENQEIVITTGCGENLDNKGAILCFNYQGEELYDIDHNPTTISGFANIKRNMTCTPAIGDIDDDGILEIVVATRINHNDSINHICIYKNTDADHDGIPDLVHESTIAYRNFNGVVLDDLNNDGLLEIIVPNQGRNGQYNNTYLEVFDCYGNYYYPKNTIKVLDTCNHDEKAVTMPVVSDLDNDGHKEIVFGLENGIYMWSCASNTIVPLIINGQNERGRKDCPVIVADIDNDDNQEIIYMSIKNQMGFIKAINKNGIHVNGWHEDNHFISLSQNHPYWEWPSYFTIADIDNDGNIEVFIADSDTLKMWKNNGSPLGIGEIYIEGLDCRYLQPVIADVDHSRDCEIIIPSNNGYIYAYNTTGDLVEGWPLLVPEIASIPVVTDINNDGLNEIISASQTAVYVWNTQGESINNKYDRFRYNQYNNVVYDSNCTYINNPITISDTQVWNSNKMINKDIVVNNDAALCIKSEIKISQDAKIIVKQGGRLILDGCKLKSACNGEMWQGIEVWGDSNADQQSHHGTYYQGYLEMKNGATIENAVCAVELWHPNYWGTTGGIIHATDAIFRNNAKAVHALNYVDHNLNGNEIAYNSQFTKCSFIIDEDYLGTETFFKHVDLANVNSVYFSGCDFSVEPKADGVSPSCMGIGAYGAGFLVKSYCEEPNMHPSCPESDIVRCTFEGFNNGILSINENSQARSFTVRDASFIKNNRGVFIQNTGYATIVRSDFQIGGNSSCGYGIYADGVTGFRIEENSFSPSQGVQCPTYGIGIFNSQGVNDVYLNSFDGLTCANVAYGVNHIADVSGRPPATIPGLTYSCNDNTGNGIDFCVLKDNGSGGIASPQGSATVPAGNTFSGSNYHFYNGGDYEVKYFCKLTGANEIPDPTKMQYVDSDTITCSNDCASHYGNGGVVRSTEEKAALAAIYQSSSDAHERMTAAGDIIRSCLNEDAIDAAVLRQWLGNMHELASDRMAIASYIQEGDFTSALSLAGSLPSTYNLQGDDLSDHNDYMTLLGLYQTLHNSNRTVHEMTSSETDMVKDMAENGLGASQQMARAILMTINDRYIEPYICPDMPRNPDRGTTSGNANPTANVSELSVIVAPIPATTWVSVDYKLPYDTGSATMSVFNSLGIKVMEVELEGLQGTKTLDLHGMPDGVYSYVVRCGEYQNTGKLIITL